MFDPLGSSPLPALESGTSGWFGSSAGTLHLDPDL